MMNEVLGGYPIFSLITYPIEIYTAAMLFAWPLEHRRNWAFQVFLGILGIVAILVGNIALVSIYPQLLETLLQNAMLSSLFWCTLLFLGAIGLIWLGCRVPFREALYCASCAYLMEHMAYCIGILVSLIPGVGAVGPGKPVYYVIYVSIYAIIYRYFCKRMVQNGHYSTEAVYSLQLTAGVLLVVLIMSVAATAYGFTTIHAMYALFCCWYALYGQLKQQRQLDLQGQLQLQQQLWVQQKNQYELSRETISIINRKCHDMKHQIAAIRTVEDDAYKTRMLDDLEQEVMIYDAAIATGNHILDTVLTEKSLLCRQHGIALKCMADGKELNFMDAVDLYTLFGNALDNAIEAQQRLKKEQRSIHVSIRRKAGLLLIQIVNPYKGEITMENGLPVTIKEERTSHGFGVGSIRRIAEKYNGVFQLKAEEGLFTLRITFQLAEAKMGRG